MSTPAKGAVLLRVLTEHAENGWVCPSIPQLAKLCGIEKSSVSEYLRRLRQSGHITSRLVHVKPHGQARVVTITATGKSTATPKPTKRAGPVVEPFVPTATALTSTVRVIPKGSPEHRAIERRLLAREDEQRRRREMWA